MGLREIAWKENETGCWTCVSHISTSGFYPIIQRNGKLIRMSHFIYEKYYGRISKSSHVLHRCDNPQCINPKHLFLGSNYDNVKDRDRKGRQSKGSERPSAKLKERDIPMIRALLAEGQFQKIIAEKYNVSQKAICDIANGKSWKHVPIKTRRDS